MYWHWHSIHNACETYWKGILSHDLQENAIYREVSQIGKSFEALSDKLIHLKKTNQAAIMVSNEALTALNWFQIPGGKTSYNDVVRWIYDALYEQNIECDIIWTDETNLDAYKVIFVPALYLSLIHILGMMKADETHVALTLKGMEVANWIMADFCG